MNGSKPTLGYPSRTDAVIALRGQGMHTQAIASRIGISTSAVLALECSAAKTKKRAKRPAEDRGRTVLFPIIILDSLRAAAAKRDISVNALARLIVETVSDDNMVDAVLDDGHCT